MNFLVCKLKKFLLLLTVVFIISLSSCSKKKFVLEDQNEALYNLSYTIAARNFGSKKDFSRLDLYYFPDCLKRFLFSEHTDDGKTLLLIEVFHPEHAGELETKGFYCPYSDNALWVDELLVLVEETRIADEINQLENDENEASLMPATDSFENSEEAETDLLSEQNSQNQSNSQAVPNVENKKNGESDSGGVEKYLYSGNQIGAVTVDNEIFLPPQEKGGRVVVHSSKGNVTRSIYDDSLRLNKIEYWSIRSASDSKLIKTEEYTFISPESRNPATKVVTKDETKQCFYYDADSKCQKLLEYKLTEEEQTLVSQTDWTYNQEGEVLTQNVQEFSGDTTFTKLRKFVYNKKDVPPDSLYYENGILKLSTTYSTEKDYVSKIFFDDDFAVTTYYEGGIRVKDVYTMGKNVLRVKNYE